MRKISVLLILVMLLLPVPCSAKAVSNFKLKAEQNRVYKSDLEQIKVIMKQQMEHANKHDAAALESFYANDFVNSDGLNKKVYIQLIKDTFETYPDISYKTYINNIQINDNYATVEATELATATSKEEVGDFETIGELLSASKCVYYFEKHGTVWLITSEKVLEETSTLKFGTARYINIELNAPKQVASGKYYTSTLKVDAPESFTVVASIGQGDIIYPQEKVDETYRKLNDNILERVFKANNKNVNEYNSASVGITHSENYDKDHIKVYMTGLAFVMTRVNVIPENKYVEEVKNEQNK